VSPDRQLNVAKGLVIGSAGLRKPPVRVFNGTSELLLTTFQTAFTPNAQNTPTGRLGKFFPERAEDRTLYSDSEIYEISSLLKQLNPRWSKVPRTYIILRTLGHLNVIDDFIDLGFTDHRYPVTETELPHCLHPSIRSKFVSTQNLVLTKSVNLEKGEAGHHAYFKSDEPLPFEIKGVLGSGVYGKVDKVLSLISFKEYARKRVLRSSVFRGRRMQDMALVIAEIEALKRLKHRHVVELVGSYTDHRYIGLIMSPVAEMDLSTYLTRADTPKYPELRTFFGCLARTLEFLHEQKVRHKDIKPRNILVNQGHVLFTDFGLSFDFADADSINGMTPRYCAPEVAFQEPRNTSSDIWSLGVVFLEMVVVLKGKTIEYMDAFFKEHGSGQAFVRTNHPALADFVAELREMGTAHDNRALDWTEQMLLTSQDLRPTAASLAASITSARRERDGNAGFCGICCI
jgi:hypothetical protein